MKRMAGPMLAASILAAVGAILVVNLDLSSHPSRSDASRLSAEGGPKVIAPAAPASPPRGKFKGNVREYPIGDEVAKNSIRVAAVWLPPIAMDGSAMAGSDIIHLEADVKATEGNPQGFALGEFIPYLKIHYEIRAANSGGAIQKGELLPMIAADGLHYGASVPMPKAGEFKLTYRIQPPSAGGLGRHSDPVTGVEPWWEPFTATFDWDYEGPPGAGK